MTRMIEYPSDGHLKTHDPLTRSAPLSLPHQVGQSRFIHRYGWLLRGRRAPVQKKSVLLAP
jgi:hypothetical protein